MGTKKPGNATRGAAQLWLTNGHAGRRNTAVMRQLRELGTASARKVAVMLLEIGAIATLAYRREEDLFAIDYDYSEGEPVLDALARRCWRLDRRFDKVAPQCMSEVDAFLRD